MCQLELSYEELGFSTKVPLATRIVSRFSFSWRGDKAQENTNSTQTIFSMRLGQLVGGISFMSPSFVSQFELHPFSPT
jgi:hypothetical protein